MVRRYRKLVIGLTAAVVGGLSGLGFAGAAYADGTAVDFNGAGLLGLPLLSCASQPSAPDVSVTGGGSVEVNNRTGHSAVVYVNGARTSRTIGADEGAPIAFEPGTWTVALVPSCLLNLTEADTLTVTATEPASVSSPPVSTSPSVAPTHGPTHGPTTDPTSGPTGDPVRTPAEGPSGAPGTGSSGRSTTTSTGALAPTGSGPTTSGTSSGSSASGGDVSSPSAQPGDDPFQGAAPPDGVRADAAGPGDGVTIGGTVALPAADISTAPDYLLAVIAMISILCVGSASVRALIRQRAQRTA